MIELTPPNEQDELDSNLTIFLAGSIEMGKAEEWQKRFISYFEDCDITFFNPRRTDWNPNAKQSIDDEYFNKQVNWELHYLEVADIVVMYLLPDTISPVSLIEFGLYARSKKLLLVCPDGFHRKGNIEVTCKKYNVTCYDSLDELMKVIKQTYCLK